MSTARALAHLGYVLDRDYLLIDDAGVERVIWYTTPPSAATIAAATRDAALAHITERIKFERDRRRLLGARVGEVAFHSDDTSRIQQLGLLMMGASMPAGLRWKAIGGVMVDMTPAMAQQLFAATAARDQSLFEAAEFHIAAASLLADPSAYDYSQGWPE